MPMPRRPLPALLLAILPAALPCTVRADTSPLAETDAERAAIASPQDRSFVMLYLGASQAASEAGRLAARRASDPAVRACGEQQDESYLRGGRELQLLVAPLGLTALPPADDAERRMEQEQLQQVPAASFDRDYLARQLRDQADLIRVLEIEVSSGANPDLRAFARTQLARLQEQQEQARALAERLAMHPGAAAPQRN